MSRCSAIVVKAEPVDHTLIGLKAEQTWSWITRLRSRGDGADFDETKAEPQQGVRHLRIFVEPGGKTDRIRKFEPESAHGQFIAIGGRLGHRHVAQRLDRECVRILRIEGPQQRSRQAVEKTDHRARLRTCMTN